MRFTSIGTGLILLAAGTAPLRAQKMSQAEKLRRRMDYLRDYDVTSQLAAFKPGVTMGKTMLTSGDLQTTYMVVHRTASSVPEVHARWDDLVIVHSGTGAVIFGDSLVGSTYRGPGERRGGKFVNQYQVVLHQGDVLRIPAAVPHAFIVGSGQTMDYVVIKSRKQELPIRWYGDESKPETPAPTIVPRRVSRP